MRAGPDRPAAFGYKQRADAIFQLAADPQVVRGALAGEAVAGLADLRLDRFGLFEGEVGQAAEGTIRGFVIMGEEVWQQVRPRVSSF